MAKRVMNSSIYGMFANEISELRRKAHAFDLIKDKEVDVNCDIFYFNYYGQYYDFVYYTSGYEKDYILTREEWDFLKEILECDYD